METDAASKDPKQIEKFLDEFISVIYKGNDHIVARKYYRELFLQLIPKYFCLCDDNKKKTESKLS